MDEQEILEGIAAKLLEAVNEFEAWRTAGGTRAISVQEEKDAVKRSLVANDRLRLFVTDKHKGKLATAKLGLVKASTFEDMRKAISKISIKK